MSSYFAKLTLAAVTGLGLLFTSGTLSAQDVTIKVENGTAKTVTVSPNKDANDDGKKMPFAGKRAAVDLSLIHI